jgi:CRISPR-associated protein Csb1
LLVPEEGHGLVFELLPANGGESQRCTVSSAAAAALVAEASAEATKHGLPWEREPLKLKPAPKLAALIRESRKRAAGGELVDAEDMT